ncbi:hypothetical protein GCM10011521_25260 [Arenimonas soli]|uniref:Uncharacterized protein n=1 Tax=Arenimonas soli TaxID=2269504 RepID=A0ABQ1HS43_9GAMM|nr:hypothetical protein [Arenimonas soli]GGA85765.1 hypothetical protein GCM10011521_25260 [Arenimonas soli]
MDGNERDHGSAVEEVALVVLSHSRLRDKPAHTLESLRIFLRGQAAQVYAELRAGRPVVVRSGPRLKVEPLASSMADQGFGVQVRRVRLAASA